MKFLLITLLLAMASTCLAYEIKKGVPLADASKAMKAAKYPETGLAMGTFSKERLGLKMWSVDDGVLIVVYSEVTQKITGVSFYLSDERPKATRKTFEFDVKSFDTVTGDLLLATSQKQKSQKKAE